MIPESALEAGMKRNTDLSTVSETRLIILRFKKHRLAVVSLYLLCVLYFLAIFAPFISPYDPVRRDAVYRLVPPAKLHFRYEGAFHIVPAVYPIKSELDRRTYKTIFTEDLEARPARVKFFVQGDEYRFLGFKLKRHLYGLDDNTVKIMILGADDLGRDMFSRILYGGRVSLSIGLIGVALSLFLGLLLGGLAGYLGGIVDNIIQRIIEFIMCIPNIPLWMCLAAVFPVNWPMVKTYFAITVILSLVGWTSLGRVVRGKFLSLRNEDYILAAQAAGRSSLGVVFVHLIPSFMSHIIASVSMAIPSMILGETSLSFLGIGLQPPAISWGVLLKTAQNLQTVALAPWLLTPGIFVVFTVLTFNFLGDGIRDASDPYADK
jgi:peptide/nickel transport system permease protein